jgi:alanine dehydrogenase
LGASVTVFDNNIYKLMRLQSHLGFRVFTSVISPAILDKEMKNADVVIGAIHSGQGRTQMIVSEEMVSHMKPGSVIVDVSIDQGGCFETSEITTHDQPTFIKHDVIHYCVPNIASRVSRTATQAISNILCPLLLRSHELGGVRNLLLEDSGVRHGAYIYKGNLINEYLSKKFDIKLTNLELLFSRNI